MFSGLSCPSSAHKKYVDYAISFAQNHSINLLLKGSLIRGTATKYSDIDIVLLCDNNDLINQFVAGYGGIILSARTQRPKGILIVVYEDGLCIDIDVRNKITKQELEDSVVLHNVGMDAFIAADIERAEDLVVSGVPLREEWYQLLRLFHRSLIKTLSGKYNEGEGLLQEIREALDKEASLPWNKQYKKDIDMALRYMQKQYPVSDDISKLLNSLIEYL